MNYDIKGGITILSVSGKNHGSLGGLKMTNEEK